MIQPQRAEEAAKVFNKEADDRCGRLRSRVQARETKVARKEESKDGISLSVRFESDYEEIELKSLILAQIERWRHALHMQVVRQRGLRPGGEWRTGE